MKRTTAISTKKQTITNNTVTIKVYGKQIKIKLGQSNEQATLISSKLRTNFDLGVEIGPDEVIGMLYQYIVTDVYGNKHNVTINTNGTTHCTIN